MRWKVEVKVNLKEGILDPQGTTIANALHSLGYNNVDNVRVGKDITLYLDEEDKGLVENKAEEICRKLLSNPVIEDYEINIQAEG